QKILSAHAVSSRRAAEELIREGRVTVNGYTAGIGDTADDELDAICVDGRTLPKAEEPVYIMLNKPRGYITSKSDNRGRLTVMQLMSGAGAAVYPVGRLDMESEGLLIMTNDGQFANAVMHPSFNKAKTYEVSVSGDIGNAVKLMRRPMHIGPHTVKAASVKIMKKTGDSAVLSISINEGRNRQIRKMCAQSGLTATSLKRVSIGDLKLGALKPGEWRYLEKEEIEKLHPPPPALHPQHEL
ncbi:MAG: rRNA pseudouridine synthase, partial [Kiritimatiellaeota bacterium]|nr:rRNA pseudouridine synthase [Kiritimatiellota bacterium]